ncbi:hypothetical protein ACE1BS_24980, partial [Aeromonas jandaei]
PAVILCVCDCCYGKKAVLNQRKKALVLRQGLFGLAPPAGLEPATCGLTVHVPAQITNQITHFNEGHAQQPQ